VPGISDDERLEISTNEGKCFRVFNCIDDKPVPYSEYTCEISDIKGDWWGEHFYQDGLPVFILNWNLGNPSGGKMSTRNVIARKEYLEMPAPDASKDMNWARYPILSDDGTNPAQFRYVERAYTKGGLPPPSCNGQSSVQVPFQAYYYFYACKDPKAAEKPKEEPPKVAEAPVEPTATVPMAPSVQVPIPVVPAQPPIASPVQIPAAPIEDTPTATPTATPTVTPAPVEDTPTVSPAPSGVDTISLVMVALTTVVGLMGGL
jgi:hypothetical protein